MAAALLVEMDVRDKALKVDVRVVDEDTEDESAAAAALLVDAMIVVESVLRLELMAREEYSETEE